MCACRPERAPDLTTDGCEPPYGCWELNSRPLEEQAMLLTTEPALQPPFSAIFLLLLNFLQFKDILWGLERWLSG